MMKPMKLHMAVTLPLIFLAAASGQTRFAFFPLDNGVGRGEWTPDVQAQTVKELGYAGIGYNYIADRPDLVAAWRHELEKRGLKLFSLYIYTFPDKPEADRYPAKLREAIAALKGSGTVIWMTLREVKDKQKTGYDEVCVKMVNEVAGWASESGLKVALYGHLGFYVANAEEALRIVKKSGRPDVGVTLNLCHELMQNNGGRLDDIVRQVAPRLFLVTVSGADQGGKPGGYIQRLDQGNFDVYGFLKNLKEAGYSGPVGLQCVGIKGDIRENLERSKRAWDGYMSQLWDRL